MDTRSLFRNWTLTALIVLLIMLTHVSEPSIILGRYSYSYFGALVVMALILGVALVGWRFHRQVSARAPTLPASPLLAAIVITATALLVWLAWWYLPGGKSDVGVVVFHLYICGLIIGAGAVLLNMMGLNHRPLAFRISPLAFVILGIVLVALYLGRVPPSRYYEEPYVLDWAWSSYIKGTPNSQMIPAQGLDFFSVSTGVFIPLMGAWLDITDINLESARLYVLLLAWAGAPFIFFIARRLYNHTVAVIALAIALILPIAHNYAYPTTYVSTAVAIALYCYLRGRDSGRWQWHYLCGLVVSSGFESHAYAFCFAAAFGLVHAFQYAQALYRARRIIFHGPFWAFISGGLTYAIAFILLHGIIWGQTDLFGALQLVRDAYAVQSSFGFARDEFGTGALMAEWLYRYLLQHPIEFFLLILGVGVALRRFQAADRLLLALFSGSILCFSLLIAHYNPYYWVHHLPFTALFAALFIADAYQAIPERPTWHTLLRLVGALVIFWASVDRLAARGQNHDELIAISYQINDLLPPEVENVSGFMIYYYGLSGRHFVHSGTFVDAPAEMWETKYGISPPQAVIVTLGLDNQHAPIKTYIEANAFVEAACFPTQFFGKRVLLYTRPEWSPNDPPRCQTEK